MGQGWEFGDPAIWCGLLPLYLSLLLSANAPRGRELFFQWNRQEQDLALPLSVQSRKGLVTDGQTVCCLKPALSLIHLQHGRPEKVML